MDSDERQKQINEPNSPLSECDSQGENQKGTDCDACNRTNLSPDEIYRAYGANFCPGCFEDCIG